MDAVTYKKYLANEADAFERWLEIRNRAEAILHQGNISTSEKDVLPALKAVVDRTFAAFIEAGFGWDTAEPAHAIGHVLRDYLNTVVVLHYGQYENFQAIIGGVGGVFHDIGTSVVDRYKDHERVVRHAEATGLILYDLWSQDNVMSDQSQLLAAYSIGAHSNYHAMKSEPISVKCADGVHRKIEPYVEAVRKNEGILCVQLPRWIDRLENCGPTHMARHFLTLIESHKDFDGEKGEFYDVGFKGQMRPLLRDTQKVSADKQGKTLLEHMRMMASSQNNDSPFGCYDRGVYRYIRDLQKERAFRILNAVREGSLSRQQADRVRHAWVDFLRNNIEPTQNARRAIEELDRRFDTLSEKDQVKWLNVFYQGMKEYIGWFKLVETAFDDLPEHFRIIPGLDTVVGTNDIFDIVRPDYQVEKVVAG